MKAARVYSKGDWVSWRHRPLGCHISVGGRSDGQVLHLERINSDAIDQTAPDGKIDEEESIFHNKKSG
jgi:hypothetical protein